MIMFMKSSARKYNLWRMTVFCYWQSLGKSFFYKCITLKVGLKFAVDLST